jgi:hypothetical protein
VVRVTNAKANILETIGAHTISIFMVLEPSKTNIFLDATTL